MGGEGGVFESVIREDETADEIAAAQAKGPSPLPWEYEDPADACCGRPCTENGCHEGHPTGTFQIIGPGWTDERDRLTNEADAALIVRAVNLHGTLLEALRGIDAALNQPATFPADVALARAIVRNALRAVR